MHIYDKIGGWVNSAISPERDGIYWCKCVNTCLDQTWFVTRCMFSNGYWRAVMDWYKVAEWTPNKHPAQINQTPSQGRARRER